MMMLLTGASGFVGAAILETAQLRGMSVRPVFRCQTSAEYRGAVIVPTLAADTDWSAAVSDIDVVIHCAARVHVMRDSEADPLMAFRAVNVEGTLNLARQSAHAGVKRFIFVSSVKVNGEGTHLGCAYFADDVAAPEDAYGISKAEAEDGLRLLSHETGMEVVIIRPPLVYGPKVKGNFNSILKWVDRGLPLPLGAVTTNRRSFVGLDNLVDLILTCVDHPKAANQTFLVSDNDDLSTADLLRRIGKALNQSVYLMPVPLSLLSIVLSLLGKRAIADRLLNSLQVDISKTCTLLDWKPPVSVDEGLRSAVKQRL
jgi:nucleoside-diphosphate-sugar epimerase